jgi:voltage-gated potassium channel
VGYGDVTPSSAVGKIVSIMFAFLGIICVALLTANIIEINAEYENKIQKF